MERKRPFFRIVGYGLAGCDPSIMGIGPAPAIRALLGKTGINLADIDEIEINEAFGAQTLACQKELGIDMNKLNTWGGAIAIGHPLAASGSRISASLVHKIRYLTSETLIQAFYNFCVTLVYPFILSDIF